MTCGYWVSYFGPTVNLCKVEDRPSTDPRTYTNGTCTARAQWDTNGGHEHTGTAYAGIVRL
jgi:hypothetical protein